MNHRRWKLTRKMKDSYGEVGALNIDLKRKRKQDRETKVFRDMGRENLYVAV